MIFFSQHDQSGCAFSEICGGKGNKGERSTDGEQEEQSRRVCHCQKIVAGGQNFFPV